MRRNACSTGTSPLPLEERDGDGEAGSPHFFESAAFPRLLESHHRGPSHEEATDGVRDDVGHGALSLDTAAGPREDGGVHQGNDGQQMPLARPGFHCRGGDLAGREHQDASDVFDSGERDEYEDDSSDSEECPMVKTRGGHSVSKVCGGYLLQQHDGQTIPAISITNISTPEVNPSCPNSSLYPSFDGDGTDTEMPCDRSNAVDDRGDFHGGPGGDSGDRRRRHGVYQVPHPIYPDTLHSNRSQPPFDQNHNGGGDFNGNFQAADESASEPNPGSIRRYSRLLPASDVDRGSRWSLPGGVASRARNDVRKVRDLGRRVMSTLLRIPGRLRGQSLSSPLLASPTDTSPSATVKAQLPFEETMV